MATGVLGELCEFENILMLKTWYAILVKFNVDNRALQKSDLNLSVTVQLYQSLINHVEDFKNQFDDFFHSAKLVYQQMDGDTHTFRTRLATTSENMEQRKPILHRDLFLPVMDSLLTNFKKRLNCYVDMDFIFSFLIQLKDINCGEISTACQEIALFYKNDTDATELIFECEIAKHYFFADPTNCSHVSMYSKLIKDESQSIFRNIEIILRCFCVYL